MCYTSEVINCATNEEKKCKAIQDSMALEGAKRGKGREGE